MADFANMKESEIGVEIEGGTVDDNSSDSSDDDVEEVEISQLLDEVIANPYQYDAHLKLITLLRQAGELEKLRKARQNMSELFPLTAELWMQWIQDELKLLGGGEERQKVMQLFDLAVKDYLAVDVWLEYCQFSVGGIGTPEGIQQARSVFEAAIMAAGLHVAEGSAIWEVYREFENALLSTLQPKPGAIPSEEKQREIKGQMNRVSVIFKRQLAIPLLDMEQTWCEYDQWMSDIGEEIPAAVKESYQRALDMLDNYREFENNLLVAEPPKLTEYLEYIEQELKVGNPARIQCIYERALEENCLNMTLWKEYSTYLDETLKIKSVILPVYERAVRNCPWSMALWQSYLKALERHEEPFRLVQTVFEKAVVAGFSSSSDYLQLWQIYVDFLRRRIPWESNHNEELEVFRSTVGRAIIYQAQYFDTEGDPTSSLQQYLAFVEAKYCGNVERMRELWNDIMSMGHGSEAQMWLQYITQERRFGDTKHVRKVFHRAIHSVSDWPETVFESFLNFEREEGTLDSWSSAVRRVETQMKRVTEQRNRAAEQEASWSKQMEERRRDSKNKPRGDRKGGKRGFDEPGTSKQPSKKQKKDANSINKSNDSPDRDSQAGPSNQSSSSSIASPSVKSSSVFKVPHVPAPRGVYTENDGQAVDPVAMETEPGGSNEQPTTKAKSKNAVMHSMNRDPRTVFVKNLEYSLTDKDIRDKFTECGAISEVRMVTNYQSKFKGYCYIEFEDEESAQRALQKDRELLGNRPMYVDPSRDTSKTPLEKKFKYENKMEKNKLFVSGLPRSLTKDELEKCFAEYGPLEEVRLVTYRSGTPKGLAYVEFELEASASKAVIGLDNTKIGEHTISVAISNPPTRKQPIKDAPPRNAEERDQKPLGAKGIIGPRGKGRTQVSLLPRSLHRQAPGKSKPSADTVITVAMDTAPAVSSNGTKGDEPGVQKTKMTNADFSKMFLK